MDYSTIKILLQLFEAPNFQGQHIELSEQWAGDLSIPFDFVGRTQSVKVFAGPGWTPDDLGRVVTLSSLASLSVTIPGQVIPTLDLRPGEYPNVLDLLRSAPGGSAATTIASVAFPDPPVRVFVPGEFSRIPVVVELYEHADFRGRMRILYADEADLAAGTGFGNMVSSVKVLPGPNFVAGLGCKLFQQAGFGGAVLALEPSEVPRLEGFTNDEISSVQVGARVADLRNNPHHPL